MPKSFVLLLCSLSALSSHFVYGLGVDHGGDAALLASNPERFHRRQEDDGSSSSTTVDIEELTVPPTVYVLQATTTSTTSSAVTVTSIATTTSTTSSAMTVTSIATTTSYSTTVIATSTATINSAPTASDCATLNQQLNGNAYDAPMGNKYFLQCGAYFYSDDSNTIATYYNVTTYRDCADICDQDDDCNLYFLGTPAAGDQDQECFLLSSDIYGEDSNSPLADAGYKVGYVSQAG